MKNDTVLELAELVIRYPTGFTVGPCEGAVGRGLYHLRGRNGSGKTTLFRAICGELRPAEGVCRVLGEDTWRTPRIRRQLGFLPADPELPGFMRVDECWRFHASLRGEPTWDGTRLREAIDLDGGMLLEHASSGQRRSAELLSALAGDPRVLLLDEPFASLDEAVRACLASWLEGWRRDRVIIITGHSDLPLPVDATWTLQRGEGVRFFSPDAR